MSLSMVEVAYQILLEQQDKMAFTDLWKVTCEKMGYTKPQESTKMSQFYTNLMLDNRLVLLDNKWDIRARHTFSEVVLDTSLIDFIEDEESDDEVVDYDLDSPEAEEEEEE
jgi:DNA-directed RNA polymerase subunit delta